MTVPRDYLIFATFYCTTGSTKITSIKPGKSQ
jgi:hypothetical protein